MVGGLVMGALEKLYRQPSLFAYALLARVQSLPLLFKRGKKAQPCLHCCRYSATAPCGIQNSGTAIGTYRHPSGTAIGTYRHLKIIAPDIGKLNRYGEC